MDKDMENYFLELCKKNNIKVVPKHYPNINTKDEIDLWFKMIITMFEDE